MSGKPTVRSLTYRKYDTRARQGGGGGSIPFSNSLNVSTLTVTGLSTLNAVNSVQITNSGTITTDSATISGTLNASYITATTIVGNVVACTEVDASGTVSANTIFSNGNISAGLNIYATGDVNADDVNATNYVTGSVFKGKVYQTPFDFTYQPRGMGKYLLIAGGSLSPLGLRRTCTLPITANYEGLDFTVIKSHNYPSYEIYIMFPLSVIFYDLNNNAQLPPYRLMSTTQYRATIVVAGGNYWLVSRN